MTRIVCISDLHEHLVDIPACDLLLIAGDVSLAFKGDLRSKRREVLERQRAEATARRRNAVHRTSGALTGTYESDYLDRLRDDWPA